VGFHAFQQSVLEHSSIPVAFIPLRGEQRDGTNVFTYERFRIPLGDFCGPAIFADASDMLCRADIAELLSLYDETKAVQVVKHSYQTKHPRKYVGTEMESPNESYPRKNWSSLILWNAGHKAHVRAAEKLRGYDGAYLHRFAWLDDEQIGELPAQWNHLVGEQDYDPGAKLCHFTVGIPGFTHYAHCDYADEWRDAVRKSQRGL